MERGNVVSLDQYRQRLYKRRVALPGLELMAMASHDANLLARRLCQHLVTLGVDHPLSLTLIADRLMMSEEDALIAATYAHVRAWVVYANHHVVLTNAGRAMIEGVADVIKGPADSEGDDKRSA